ncbi:hypothetical protein [Novosphingobium sp. FSW06-99]|uniref:hypothetical protein n=1 Tax=Novosphingobium sp. FSW06-99 TaxID=1739113 RepID=UPI00076D5143|nr:hypothetical protein [Novosphingobium sp. FSW06-99]KUR75592.1 hypothetical protein AQZ49_14035 [Novosphingobium sp. FSW06-99]
MNARLILIAVLGPVVFGGTALARPAHRAVSGHQDPHQTVIQAVHSPAHSAGIVGVVPVRAAQPMISRTGANRTSATVARSNGIAGTDFIQPVTRNAAGGATARSGVIEGGTFYRRH